MNIERTVLRLTDSPARTENVIRVSSSLTLTADPHPEARRPHIRRHFHRNASEADTRTHDKANELTQRALNSTSGSPFTLTYDDAGNLKTNGSASGSKTFTHDAWNRLVKVEVTGQLPSPTIGKYEYNGLHWRTVADADRASPGGLDQRKVIYYSAGWQVLQEDIDNHTNNSSLNGVDKRSQQIWGIRYIDDAVAKRADTTANGSFAGTDDKLYFYCTDAQFSTVALLDKAAHLVERVSYSAYGVATAGWHDSPHR